MKKIIVSALSIISLSSMLNGEGLSDGSVGFIGIEVGNTQLRGSRYMNIYDGDSYNAFYDGSGVEIGLKLGAQNEEWRTTLAMSYYDNEDEDQNYEKANIMIDYFLANSETSGMSIKPYIGASIGYMGYESTFIDESDMVYGGQAGIVLNSAMIDFDLSYRYSLYNGEQADTMGTIMFGANYLF
jgi:hypothetical protein